MLIDSHVKSSFGLLKSGFKMRKTGIKSWRAGNGDGVSISPIFNLLLIFACLLGVNGLIFADPGLRVRAENIIVPPSTGPLTHIIVSNQGAAPFKGTLKAKYPKGWVTSPGEVEILLGPGEVKGIPISIDEAIDLKANSYPVEVVVIGNDDSKVFKRNIFVATSPVFKTKIDAKLGDWKPAVPITFDAKGQKTIIRTGWNKKYFNVAIEVEEKKLIGYKKGSAKPIDAVQFAIAPRKSKTPDTAGQSSQRYEFLIVDCPGFFATDKCFRLMQPGDDITVCSQARVLGALELKGAKVAVKHAKGITIYECSIPLSAMPKVKPMTGRDYLMSFLVHDPDGTGIRDLGKSAGLWGNRRNKFAWSSWQGVKWGEKPPFDSKIEWGFCTTKY